MCIGWLIAMTFFLFQCKIQLSSLKIGILCSGYFSTELFTPFAQTKSKFQEIRSEKLLSTARFCRSSIHSFDNGRRIEFHDCKSCKQQHHSTQRVQCRQSPSSHIFQIDSILQLNSFSFNANRSICTDSARHVQSI